MTVSDETTIKIKFFLESVGHDFTKDPLDSITKDLVLGTNSSMFLIRTQNDKYYLLIQENGQFYRDQGHKKLLKIIKDYEAFILKARSFLNKVERVEKIDKLLHKKSK